MPSENHTVAATDEILPEKTKTNLKSAHLPALA